MWTLPRRRVFVDSRLEAYSPDLLRFSRLADLYGDYAEAFRRYGIICAVVATGSPLYRRLIDEAPMRLVYQDASRTIFSTASNAGPEHLR
jgi:hypothetical protein